MYDGNNKVLKNIQFYSALKNDRYFQLTNIEKLLCSNCIK